MLFLVSDIGLFLLINTSHFCYHLVYEIVGELQSFEFLDDLIFQFKNLDVLVGTFFLIVGPIAMVVRFLFQRMILGCVSLSALVAKDKAAQEKVMFVSSARVAVILLHDFLAFIKKVFVDDRLMLADVVHVAPFHRAVIKRTLDSPEHFAHGHSLADGADQSFLVEQVSDFNKGIISSRVEFEKFSNERSAYRIRGDDSSFLIVRLAGVEVSHRCFCRPPSVFIFLLHALECLS